MRSVDSATEAAAQSRVGIIRRNFVWLEGKNRVSGAVETMGLWNGDADITINVISGTTGLSTARDYVGCGPLLAISPIPLVSDLTIRTVTISLSPIDEAVEQAIRGYDPRQGRVEIHRGFYSLDTHLVVAPPVPRFIGRINKSPIKTPAVGGEGSVEVECVSDTRELTKINPAKKSDETQKLRSGDRFRRYGTVAGEVSVFWGEDDGHKRR